VLLAFEAAPQPQTLIALGRLPQTPSDFDGRTDA